MSRTTVHPPLLPARLRPESQVRGIRSPNPRFRLIVAGLALPATALSLSSCTPASKPLAPPYPATLPPRQELSIWTGDSVMHLHGIRFHGDSLSGVPILRPPSCNSCRVSLPLVAVDSMQTASSERDAIILVSLPIIGGLLFLAAWAVSAGGD